MANADKHRTRGGGEGARGRGGSAVSGQEELIGLGLGNFKAQEWFEGVFGGGIMRPMGGNEMALGRFARGL